ncbi:hypothetical protein PR048_015929 [Dryococelus australis]|uniref:Uncharacterized protein n=1 Tax=Dryococelus australis TaxID=614101 RepID=A0ABQ9HIB7_9NEOP|nr:hypothetical protein PR048_015929 [Dryococelus australis]
MKSIFARLGIPAMVMSDGGSNLTSSQFDQMSILRFLSCTNTPVIQEHSPAQLIMGRKLRGCILVVPALLNPSLPNHKDVRVALLAKQTGAESIL